MIWTKTRIAQELRAVHAANGVALTFLITRKYALVYVVRRKGWGGPYAFEPPLHFASLKEAKLAAEEIAARLCSKIGGLALK